MTNNITGTSILERLSKIDMPFCVFRLDLRPTEWLSEAALKELECIGKDIFDSIAAEIREDGYFCNSQANRYAPESHRSLLWDLIYDFGDKWKSFVNHEYIPVRGEADVFSLMERLLLEGAYYFAWTVKTRNKGLMPVKYWFDDFDELYTGFESKDDLTIERAMYVRNNCGYGKMFDYVTGLKIFSGILMASCG